MDGTDVTSRGAAYLDSLANCPASGPFVAGLVCGADVKPKSVAWLWDGWLAGGMLHVLAGAPGTGKTTTALSLAATITQGGRWPDGTAAPLGDVLIWSGEDTADTTLAPRLMAMGADMHRVQFVESAQDEQGARPFDPASDLAQLQGAIHMQGLQPKLLIVDPIVSAVSGDSNKNAETRRALQPLVDFAKVHGCAVLGISHFSKGSAGKEVTERVTGSLAFGALARVVMGAAKRSEEQGGGRLFCRAKSNIGPDDGGFVYDLETVAVPDYPHVLASRVVWGEVLSGTARELLAQAEQPEEGRIERDEVKDWLYDALLHERQRTTDLKKAAERIGHAWRTVQRAATDMGVIKKREGYGPQAAYFWSLPPCVPQPDHARQQTEVARMEKDGTHGVIDLPHPVLNHSPN